MEDEKIKNIYKRYEALVEKLKWTSDEEEINKIKHDLNNLIMIIDYYDPKGDKNG